MFTTLILKYKILKIKCYNSNFTFFYSRRECTRSKTNLRARKTNKGHRYTGKPTTLKTSPNNLPCYQQTAAEPCCYQNRKLMLSYTSVTAATKQSCKCRIPQLQPRKHNRPPKLNRNKHSIRFHCNS